MRAPLRHVDGNASARESHASFKHHRRTDATSHGVRATGTGGYHRDHEQERAARYARRQEEEEAEADATMIAWKKRWSAVMATAVVYFDDTDSITRMVLKNELNHVGSKVVPFFDMDVTHVVSDRGEGEAVARALELGVKVYNSKKMARFLSGLTGRPTSRRHHGDAEAAPTSNNLKNLLSGETRMGGAEAHRDFYQFKGLYVLLWDPTKRNKPLAVAEWERPEGSDLGSWPQMRLELPCACPFMSRDEAAAAYKKMYRARKDAKRKAAAEAATANQELPVDQSRLEAVPENVPTGLRLLDAVPEVAAATPADVEAEAAAEVAAEVDAELHKENRLPLGLEIVPPQKRRLACVQEDDDAGDRTPLAVVPYRNYERADTVPENQYPSVVARIQDEARALGKDVPTEESIIADLKQRSLLARRTRTAKFGEIAASGMQRYSNSMNQSTFQSGESGAPRAQASRDLVNLQRKVFTHSALSTHVSDAAKPTAQPELPVQPELPEQQEQLEQQEVANHETHDPMEQEPVHVGETTLPEPDEERTTASPETVPAVLARPEQAQSHPAQPVTELPAEVLPVMQPAEQPVVQHHEAQHHGAQPNGAQHQEAHHGVQNHEVQQPQAALETRAAVTNNLKNKKKRRRVAGRDGWCENCLARYEDFAEHVQSRAHKNIAAKDGRFAALDGLIVMLKRTPVGGPSSPPSQSPPGQSPPDQSREVSTADEEMTTPI